MNDPLRIVFDVHCLSEHAFLTWTTRASAWWPRDHTASLEQDLEILFEPHVGGRIFERTRSGGEIEWGEITAWEPPRRLCYLWRIAAAPEDATDVEIVFEEIADGRTRVEVVHGGWERLGEKGDSWRDVNRGGWSGVVPHYIEACRAQG